MVHSGFGSTIVFYLRAPDIPKGADIRYGDMFYDKWSLPYPNFPAVYLFDGAILQYPSSLMIAPEVLEALDVSEVYRTDKCPLLMLE
jgi:hypothetical protein